jgi:hypothetical protein
MNCFVCKSEILPGTPVYRHRAAHDDSLWVESVCAECLRKEDERMSQWSPHYYTSQFRPPQPCGNCSRPVFRYLRHKRKETVFCSEACQRAIHNSRARLKRIRELKLCAKCGEPFIPKRTDSKYCSVACKQSMYRMRFRYRISQRR